MSEKILMPSSPHFQINLRCVQDVQVLEFATRRGPGRFVKGLTKCIKEELGYAKLQSWRSAKDAGCKLFLSDRGGSYDVFLGRPQESPSKTFLLARISRRNPEWEPWGETTGARIGTTGPGIQ